MSTNATPANVGSNDGLGRPLETAFYYQPKNGQCLSVTRYDKGDIPPGSWWAMVFRSEAEAEIARLNRWCDGFSDAQLKERAASEAYKRELKDSIAAVAVRLAKDATYRHRAAEDLLRIAGRNIDRAA